jgi:hypothetical protein
MDYSTIYFSNPNQYRPISAAFPVASNLGQFDSSAVENFAPIKPLLVVLERLQFEFVLLFAVLSSRPHTVVWHLHIFV